jgi:two-component system response regulator MprA
MDPALRVLVVEDDPKIAAFLVQGLMEEAYEVAHAADGIEALEMVASMRPALVILDYMLPRMDGLAVASALRRRGDRMPILMLTARDGEEDRRRLAAAGVSRVLSKPFRFDDLLGAMHELVNGR